jgi:hypothetical protein
MNMVAEKLWNKNVVSKYNPSQQSMTVESTIIVSFAVKIHAEYRSTLFGVGGKVIETLRFRTATQWQRLPKYQYNKS